MPVSSFSIDSAFNTPAQASITLPAYPQLYGIGRKDRVPVHIFVRETFVLSEEFILLFEGEITGFSYFNTALQRNISISAIGIMSMLQDVNIQFMTSLNAYIRGQASGNPDKSLQVFAEGVTFPLCLFMKGIHSGGQAAANTLAKDNIIRWPSEYIHNAYAFLQESAAGGESSYKKYNDSVLAEYFKVRSTMVKLLDRYVPVPYFDDDRAEGEIDNPENPGEKITVKLWPRVGEDKVAAFPLGCVYTSF